MVSPHPNFSFSEVAKGEGAAEDSKLSDRSTLSSQLSNSGILAYGDSSGCSTFAILLLPKIPLLNRTPLSSIKGWYLMFSSFFTESFNKILGAPPSSLKLTDGDLFDEGSRPLEVGRTGKAGGASFGRSSICRMVSSITSSELRATMAADIVILKPLIHSTNKETRSLLKFLQYSTRKMKISCSCKGEKNFFSKLIRVKKKKGAKSYSFPTAKQTNEYQIKILNR